MPPNPTSQTFNFPDPSPFDDEGEFITAKGLLSKHVIEQERAKLTAALADDEVEETYIRCREIWEKAFKANQARLAHGGLNESDTESELLDPLLTQLGFAFLHRTSQDKRSFPDYTLYPDDQAKAEALNLPDAERSRSAIGILEAKSLNKNLGSISQK